MFREFVRYFLRQPKTLLLHEIKLHGANYYDARRLIESHELEVGDVVCLRRESSNVFDEHAVAVYTRLGQKLAYLPKAQNHIVASLIDRDELLIVNISEASSKRHEPLKVKIWLIVR